MESEYLQLPLHLFAVWRKDEQYLTATHHVTVFEVHVNYVLSGTRPAIKYATACDRNCVMHHDFYVFHLKLI